MPKVDNKSIKFLICLCFVQNCSRLRNEKYYCFKSSFFIMYICDYRNYISRLSKIGTSGFFHRILEERFNYLGTGTVDRGV